MSVSSSFYLVMGFYISEEDVKINGIRYLFILIEEIVEGIFLGKRIVILDGRRLEMREGIKVRGIINIWVGLKEC